MRINLNKTYLLFVLLLAILCPVNCLVHASDYTVTNGVLVRYSGSQSEIKLPSGITAVGPKVFLNNNTIVKVGFPDTVTLIDKQAFMNCKNLRSSYTFEVADPDFIIDENGELIGYIGSDKDVVIPDTVTTMAVNVFANKGITRLTIPSNVVKINDAAIPANIKIVAAKNSVAAQWAIKHHYDLCYIEGGCHVYVEKGSLSIDGPRTVVATKTITLKQVFNQAKQPTNTAVTWSTSSASIATVNSSGVVKGVKAGIVTIKACSKEDKTICANASVKVIPLATGVTIQDSKGTNITGKTVVIHATTYQLKGVVAPSGAVQKVTWSSSATATATVDANGKVTFKKAGTVTITAKATDGSGKSATVKLTYQPPATSLIIQDSKGTNITGKTVTTTASPYQLKGVASPSGASQTFTWKSSDTNTATVDSTGKVTFKKAGTVTITATTADGSKKSASVKITYAPKGPAPVLEIKDSNIRGKNKEIQIVVPWSADLTKVEVVLYDDETGKQVSPVPTYKERMDANKKNKIVTFVGSPLENGHVYRFEIRVSNGQWSNKVSKYAMPISNVYGATVVAGNKTMIINTKHRDPADGTRYMIYDPATGKEVAYKVGTKTNTTWTYGELTNGKLYYVVAVSYRDYKGQRLWGPNENKIYFLPMSIPGNGTVSFSNDTTAKITIGKDGSVDGIRVLYRQVGGSIVNGCEGAGNSCTVKNLKKSAAYEFYAMKYKTVDGKKYYSTGTLILWNTSGSGLKAPQMNPTVAMSNSGNTTFTIKKAAEAEGLSVLYREGEGAFKQACEKAGNTCNATLDTKANYTFYIMQYKTVNGKKLYSPGIVARDFSSGKTGTSSSSAAAVAESAAKGVEVPPAEAPAEDSLEFYRLEEPAKNGSAPDFGK